VNVSHVTQACCCTKCIVDHIQPPEAEVIGFLDSPYFLDVVSYTSSFPGFPFIEQQKYMLFNTTGELPEMSYNKLHVKC
jgi:hypothetical protein